MYSVPEDYELCTFDSAATSSCLTGRRLPNLNDRVSVYWESKDLYYDACVVQRRGEFFYLIYDDGDEEWTPLAERMYTVLDQSAIPAMHSNQSPKVSNNNCSARNLASRIQSDGTIAPPRPPKRDRHGRCVRPKGRAPSGCTWNSRLGKWMKDNMESSPETPELVSSIETPVKRLKNGALGPTDVLMHEATSGTATGESSSQKKPADKQTEVEAKSKEYLERTISALGGISDKSFCLANATVEGLKQAETLLQELSSMELSSGVLCSTKGFSIAVKKLALNQRLGVYAQSAYKNIRRHLDADIVAKWKLALAASDEAALNIQVSRFARRLKCNILHFRHCSDFVNQANLPELVASTREFLESKGSALDGIEKISNQLQFFGRDSFTA